LTAKYLKIRNFLKKILTTIIFALPLSLERSTGNRHVARASDTAHARAVKSFSASA